MPQKHTSTELTVLAKDDAKETATLLIGPVVMLGGSCDGMVTAEERAARLDHEHEDDALAIMELLDHHLPAATYKHLQEFMRNNG